MGERVLSVIDKTEPCSYSEAMIFSQSMAIDDKYNNIYVSNTNPPPPPRGRVLDDKDNMYVSKTARCTSLIVISQLAALVEQSLLHLWLGSQD